MSGHHPSTSVVRMSGSAGMLGIYLFDIYQKTETYHTNKTLTTYQLVGIFVYSCVSRSSALSSQRECCVCCVCCVCEFIALNHCQLRIDFVHFSVTFSPYMFPPPRPVVVPKISVLVSV